MCLSVCDDLCQKLQKQPSYVLYQSIRTDLGVVYPEKLEFQLSINSSQPRKTDFCPPDLNSMENSAEMYTYGREQIINVHFLSVIAATCTRKPCKTLEI